MTILTEDDEHQHTQDTATCPPCLDGEHTTLDDHHCKCCGEFIEPDPCGYCGGDPCHCDDLYEQHKERLIEEGRWRR